MKTNTHEKYENNKKFYQFLLLVLMVILLGCGSEDESRLAFMTVRKGVFEIVIPAFGQLQAVKATPISVPPQLRGRQTLAWLAPENSYVKKGETVVRLDANWYNERIQAEEFSISKLNLEIQKKKKELGKEKNDLQGQLNITEIEKDMADIYGAKDETLYSQNKIIEDAIDLEYLTTRTRHYEQKKTKLEEKARAELQLLQLKKRTCQVRLQQYQEALNSLEIKAPHDGLFIYRRNRAGEEPRVGSDIYRGQKLGELPDLTQLEAKIYVLESEASGLKEDLPASIVLDASPSVVYTGKVTTVDKIAKSIEWESPLKYFEVKVTLDKTDPGVMKPGNQVKGLIFVQKQENVIAVPNQALFFDNGNAFVQVKHSSGTEKRPVEIGARSLTRTVITNGLKQGEKILLASPVKSSR
ncbi:MAG: efflux RND transporter periplasmic adaptor subunit [Candidatus Aminicenantes bacterium]|nr:MAG: efflux RND transporter periplasmic adaptor subunit [Candidatus Aminicenantes bacterium]